jgi:glycosyltransferase involved in cell wall biosynthesis
VALKAPLVSILIPAYNAERWLLASVESALAQTWRSVELLIVDDGSQDGTLPLARRLASENVKVLTQRNAGAGAARNRALRDAQGEYIQYLDADDILEPRKIEAQIHRLADAPPQTVATGAWQRFFGTSPGQSAPGPTPDWRDYAVAHEWLIDEFTGAGTFPPVAWLLPRRVAQAAGPWNEALSLDDDTEYHTRVVACSERIVFCRDSKSFYRSGHGSLSGRSDPSALKSAYHARQLCAQHLLAIEDSPRTRHACACLWQSFVFKAYPASSDLIRSAEAEIRALGGGSLRPEGGPVFRALRDSMGWRAAVQIRRLYSGVTSLTRRGVS